jgi:hypothetical protein
MKAPKRLVTLKELYQTKVLKENQIPTNETASDMDALYTIIRNALNRNHIDFKEEADCLKVEYFEKQYEIKVSELGNTGL